MPQADRAEDALLEPVVELEDRRRQRQPGQDPPAEVAHREQADRGDDHDHDADDEDESGSPAAGPSRKLQKPAASPRIAIANRSRIRSMNTVPKVRLSETALLILSSYAR